MTETEIEMRKDKHLLTVMDIGYALGRGCNSLHKTKTGGEEMTGAVIEKNSQVRDEISHLHKEIENLSGVIRDLQVRVSSILNFDVEKPCLLSSPIPQKALTPRVPLAFEIHEAIDRIKLCKLNIVLTIRGCEL